MISLQFWLNWLNINCIEIRLHVNQKLVDAVITNVKLSPIYLFQNENVVIIMCSLSYPLNQVGFRYGI